MVPGLVEPRGLSGKGAERKAENLLDAERQILGQQEGYNPDPW